MFLSKESATEVMKYVKLSIVFMIVSMIFVMAFCHYFENSSLCLMLWNVWESMLPLIALIGAGITLVVLPPLYLSD